MKTRVLLLCIVTGLTCVAASRILSQTKTSPDNLDWPVYRGDPGATQYAALGQIHAANVQRLQPAWEYHTGDASARSTMHANPIVVNGVMYLTTPSLKAVALNAATGRELWSFDPAPYNERQAETPQLQIGRAHV